MTKPIIEMAREAGIYCWHKSWDSDDVARLERFAALVLDNFNRQMNQACEEARLQAQLHADDAEVRAKYLAQEKPIENQQAIADSGSEVSQETDTQEPKPIYLVRDKYSNKGWFQETKDQFVYYDLEYRMVVYTTPPTAALATCNWTQPHYDDAECNAWITDCGEHWVTTEGKPSENGMKFCHGCGKPIAEHPYAETGEEK